MRKRFRAKNNDSHSTLTSYWLSSVIKQTKIKSISQYGKKLWSFPAISSYFQPFPAIFSNFLQLQMFCGKFWNPTKNFEDNNSIQYKVMAVSCDFLPFLANSGHFRQFPAIFGNFRLILMFCGKFRNPTKKNWRQYLYPVLKYWNICKFWAGGSHSVKFSKFFNKTLFRQ